MFYVDARPPEIDWGNVTPPPFGRELELLAEDWGTEFG